MSKRITVASIDMSKVTARTVAQLRNRVARLTVQANHLAANLGAQLAAASPDEGTQAKAVEVARQLLAQLFGEVDAVQQLGCYIGTLIVTYTGDVEPRNQVRRALWLLEWLLHYFIEQNLTVQDFATNVERHRAIEALAMIGAQIRKPREHSPPPIEDVDWIRVRTSAVEMINAIV
jgi:hypothetical protein